LLDRKKRIRTGTATIINMIKAPDGRAQVIPHRSHSKDTNEAGTIQPPIPREKYSSGVNSSPRIFLMANQINICPERMVNSMTNTRRQLSSRTDKLSKSTFIIPHG
jgi:hypothetical protein